MADMTVENPVDEHAPELYRYDTCAEYLDTLNNITDTQIQRFHEQGYLAVKQAVETDKTEAAAQAMWDLIDGIRPGFRAVHVEAKMRAQYASLSQTERRNAVRKIHRFIDYDDRLKVLSEHAAILAVLKRLMGEPPVLFQDMGLMKPARVGREKPWHQDLAYFNVPIDTPVVGVWIALDEATSQNGCLHIVPGSHKEGPQLHYKIRDWQMCDTDVPVRQSVMVPLPPGGCLFWHGLVHHGSPSNHSDKRRRALQFHYQPESTQKTTPDERLGVYGGEGQGVEC